MWPFKKKITAGEVFKSGQKIPDKHLDTRTPSIKVRYKGKRVDKIQDHGEGYGCKSWFRIEPTHYQLHLETPPRGYKDNRFMVIESTKLEVVK